MRKNESANRSDVRGEEKDARVFELSLLAVSCGLALWGIVVWLFAK